MSLNTDLDFETLRDEVIEIIKMDPDCQASYAALIYVYSHKNKLDCSVKDFKNLIKNKIGEIHHHYLGLSTVSIANDNYHDAVKYALMVMKSSDHEVLMVASISLSASYYRLKDIENMEKYSNLAFKTYEQYKNKYKERILPDTYS